MSAVAILKEMVLSLTVTPTDSSKEGGGRDNKKRAKEPAKESDKEEGEEKEGETTKEKEEANKEVNDPTISPQVSLPLVLPIVHQLPIVLPSSSFFRFIINTQLMILMMTCVLFLEELHGCHDEKIVSIMDESNVLGFLR